VKRPFNDIIVEECNEKDAINIEEVERSSFSKPWGSTFYKKEIEKDSSLCLVAKEKGRVVGFLLAWLSCGEADILRIAVLPPFRNQGIGKSLLKNLLNFLKERNIKRVYLEVNERNRAAIKLYESFGFKKVGFRKNYYGKDNAIIYSLEIK